METWAWTSSLTGNHKLGVGISFMWPLHGETAVGSLCLHAVLLEELATWMEHALLLITIILSLPCAQKGTRQVIKQAEVSK